MSRWTRRAFLQAGIAAVAQCGCSLPGRDDVRTWGRPGRRPCEFIRPRAIGVYGEQVYVVDTTGRLQVFTSEGEFVCMWSMPESDNGTPTAVSFAPDGRVVLADTHYSRILEYSATGELLAKWGSYGEGHDQFVYPTDVEIGPSGEYFVSEYGMGAERVHVFDVERRFVRQWGRHGDGPACFSRAMALALAPDGRVLVCDTGNHRVQAFSLEGEYLAEMGGVGVEPGRLRFPYDVAVAPDGSVLVCEYGNNRLTRYSPNGDLLETIGGPGRTSGRFSGPRGAAVDASGRIYVADTENDRVQVLRPGAAA